MRISLAIHRRLRTALGVLVWTAAVGAAWVLHNREMAAPAAVAIAQARTHIISPVRLGRLITLDVAEGQFVRPGEVVARFETDLLMGEVSVAQAELHRAEHDVRASAGSYDAGVLATGRGFRAEVDSLEAELETANAAASRERGELEKLDEDIRRERDLVSRGLTRSDRLMALEQHRSGLAQSVNGWPSRLEATGARLAAAKDRLVAWERTHAEGAAASLATQIQPLESRVEAHRQTVGVLRKQMEQSVVRAEAGGYVTAIHARPGSVVKPGDPVVTLVEANPRQAIAYINERRGTPYPAGTRVVAWRRAAPAVRWNALVSGVAADVTELPPRLWPAPAMPAWGRAMYVTLPPEAAVEAGELLDVMPAPAAGEPLVADGRN